AGITIASSILSSVLQLKVRRDLGMTGEITLRGRVLPIGGLKEKLLAAQRAGLKEVLFPAENERDLTEMDLSFASGIDLRPVQHMDEVIERALVRDDPEMEAGRAESFRPVIRREMGQQPSSFHQ